MTIKSDRWIQEMAKKGMIEPFEPAQVRQNQAGERVLSYGTSSYGYDVRCGNHFKVFTNIHSAMVWAVPSSAAASMALGPASAAWDHCQIRPFISRVRVMRLAGARSPRGRARLCVARA